LITVVIKGFRVAIVQFPLAFVGLASLAFVTIYFLPNVRQRKGQVVLVALMTLLCGGELASEIHHATGAIDPDRGAAYIGRIVNSTRTTSS
jgi:hypothetical protein